MIGNLDDLGVWVAWVLFLCMLLYVPFPVAGIHASTATVWLLAGMVATHMLDDLGSPATTEVTPVAQEVAGFLLATVVRLIRRDDG